MGALRARHGAIGPALSRRPRLRAQARFALVMVSLAAAAVLWLRSGLAVPPVTFLSGALPVLVAYAATALSATVALVIALRRPEVRIGRILAWVALVQCVRDLSWAYLAWAASGPAALPLDPATVAWFNYLLTIPLVATLLIALALVFPTDRPISPRWWWIAAGAAVGAALVIAGGLLRPGPLAFVPSLQNPMAPAGLRELALVIQYTGYAVLVGAAIAAAGGLVVRYRRSDRIGRIQLRVFMATSILLAGTFALLMLTSLLEVGTTALRGLIGVAFFLGTALMPLAVLLAVARYRLFAIEELVERGFVYGCLLAILAGVYAASIRLFTALFTLLSGESSDLSLVITTLILATTFTPLKARLEDLVKRSSPGVDSGPGGNETVPTQSGRMMSAAASSSGPDLADPALVDLIDARIRVQIGNASVSVAEHDHDGRPP